jgi:hypothetical protein
MYEMKMLELEEGTFLLKPGLKGPTLQGNSQGIEKTVMLSFEYVYYHNQQTQTDCVASVPDPGDPLLIGLLKQDQF